QRPCPWRTFSALPPHLLLQIVYATFSDAYDVEDAKEQRKTLYWLATGLRLVNRLFYTTSMNVLRSIYLPQYDARVRPPYTSDPFPLAANAAQRETATLDAFVALTVREAVWADDSALHLGRGEAFVDLFVLRQPRARLEDLVRDYGVAEGVIYIDRAPRERRRGSSTDLRAAEAPPTTTVTITPLPFSALSVAFSSRKAGLVLATTGSKRTMVEVSRTREEPLDVVARRLVWELRDWL
ncbi:hypothetical protein B0H10DRAFT_1629584, partial [Mycena sp. CBHHK59/15]